MSAVDQQPPLETLIDYRCAVGGQLDADHGAQDANLLDRGAARTQGFQALAEALADADSSLQEPVRFDGFDGCQGGAAGDGIAAKSGGVRAGLELFRERRPGDQG